MKNKSSDLLVSKDQQYSGEQSGQKTRGQVHTLSFSLGSKGNVNTK